MAKKQLQTVIEMQDKFSKELELFSKDLHKATDELKNFAKENEKSSGRSDELTSSLVNLSNLSIILESTLVDSVVTIPASLPLFSFITVSKSAPSLI